MVNYEFEHSVRTSADPAAVWALWSVVDRWVDWDPGVTRVVVDGPFEQGAVGVMHIDGMPPIDFRLTEVLPGKGFTDETLVPGGVVRFSHQLESLPDGQSKVTHRVEIDGPGELGPMITEDLPAAMRALVELAEQG